jgi:hypothetical protein
MVALAVQAAAVLVEVNHRAQQVLQILAVAVAVRAVALMLVQEAARAVLELLSLHILTVS